MRFWEAKLHPQSRFQKRSDKYLLIQCSLIKQTPAEKTKTKREKNLQLKLQTSHSNTNRKRRKTMATILTQQTKQQKSRSYLQKHTL